MVIEMKQLKVKPKICHIVWNQSCGIQTVLALKKAPKAKAGLMGERRDAPDPFAPKPKGKAGMLSQRQNVVNADLFFGRGRFTFTQKKFKYLAKSSPFKRPVVSYFKKILAKTKLNKYSYNA